MAGAGLKNFTAGEVLTAADVNTYLAQQAVQVYASAAARTAAVPTPSEGMVSYRSDFNIVEAYDGANWHPIDSVLNVRTAATASFSIAATDAGDLLEVNSTSGTLTVTVPPDSSLNLPVGVQVNLLAIGTATVATAAGTGVTLNGTPGLLLRAQYSSATLLKRAANTWVVIGDLKA
jgi:hypothetical protein